MNCEESAGKKARRSGVQGSRLIDAWGKGVELGGSISPGLAKYYQTLKLESKSGRRHGRSPGYQHESFGDSTGSCPLRQCTILHSLSARRLLEAVCLSKQALDQLLLVILADDLVGGL